MAKIKIDLTQRQELPAVEEQVLGYWDEIKAFQRSIDERPTDKPYVFYDGPPFVTGSPHFGSILGSIAKDVVPRFWTMKGFRVERQWGWDCHGLPMEHLIEKELGLRGGRRGIEQYGIKNFNDACRAAISRIDKTWEVIIRRIGRWVDYENSYRTMDTNYMESVWWGFKQLWEKDHVYEGRKVILYCPRCGTPLSNFEIAMDNSYQDVEEPSTTYKFTVEGQNQTYLLAWSTTPWTKLGTMALAVHPELTYVWVKQGEETYILAESALSHLKDEPYEVLEKKSGAELAGTRYAPHFTFAPDNNGAHVVVADEFVTADTGTGIVTLAVYGEDDYRVMQREQIPLYDYVNDEGRLDETITQEGWAGRKISEVNADIDAHLEAQGLIYKHEPHAHSVALCYRCGTRLYYAPLPAWFVNVQELKPALLEKNEKINWYPNHLKHGRFAKGIESAPDWNISRSRFWATPMPIWRDESHQHTRVIGSIAELTEWAVDPSQVEGMNDIHREFVDPIEVWVDDQRTIKGKRIAEVFDVWVDSGSMPFASRHYPFENQKQFEEAYPAQFISEYINQTRAWFYVMHVLSVALFEEPSFLNAHNTGVILAQDGTKMSKSKKNYPDPVELLNREGADALRLYLMQSPVSKAENLAFTEADVTMLRKRILNIWWNVFVFYATYKPADWVALKPQPTNVMDRWILALLEQKKAEWGSALENYDLQTPARGISEFVGELSQWYVRQSRDRLRQGEVESWNTFRWVLKEFSQLAAPIVPFISEAIYQNLDEQPESDSVHLTAWPEAVAEFQNPELLQEMLAIRPVIEAGHAQRKGSGMKVRQPLAAVKVQSPQTEPSEVVKEIMMQELNVKSVEWSQAEELSVSLDTTLTPELEAEGQAREIIRAVQQLRKEQSVPIDGEIILTLPSWPKEWEEAIRLKTKAKELLQGDSTQISHD